MRKLFFVGFFLMTGVVFGQIERQEVIVASITDGDTIKVYFNGVKMALRLSGYDTCETPKYLSGRKLAKVYEQAHLLNLTKDEVLNFGIEAKQYLESRLKIGDRIVIEWDYIKIDKYKRLLGYVFIGNENIGLTMLQEGLATVYEDKKVRYYYEYKEAEQKAKESKIGIWKNT